jgi:alpha-tubulin suppressor-like RCC1 family protein
VTRRAALLAVAAVFLFGAGGSAAGGPSSEASIAAGYEHTCAILARAAKCWGDNVFGQLGDGSDVEARSRPVAVSGLGSGVRAIAAGTFFSCAVADDDGARCWGDNEHSQLGDGTTIDERATPVAVSGLSTGVEAIAAGDEHACALLDGGGVKCWGSNGEGELGDGTTRNRRTPVAVSGLSAGVQAISAGDSHTCALLDSGGVQCWGDNEDGQLGDGTRKSRPTPTPVSGLARGVRAIAAGDSHTCALRDSGVACWGLNEDGELGDGTTTKRSTLPVSVTGLPGGLRSITAGSDSFHTCAVLTDGGVRCWGDNDRGQLGDGTTVNRSTPVALDALTGVEATASGSYHTCALLSTGGFTCFGRNEAGQLGKGTFDRKVNVEIRGRGAVRGPGGFRCATRDKNCDLERPQGTKVVIRAHPAKGWKFKRWIYRRRIGACKGRAPRCTVVLNANYFATAHFVKRR